MHAHGELNCHGDRRGACSGPDILAPTQVHVSKLCSCVAQYWNVKLGSIFGGEVGYTICSLLRPGHHGGSDCHN